MIGQTISHYRITEKLGEGGMGVVYKAEDTELDRPVALKFLAPHLLRDEEGRKRFRREAKAAAALDHPNICTVYEIGRANEQTFIAMAFLEGLPLSKKIEAAPLKLNEALAIAEQIAEGLGAAHEKGVVHRDIKPDNIMLLSGSRGLVKLMDFGLAQLAGSSKLTRGGSTLGTMFYMSPEQAQGAEIDHRTDIWSLGVVLYEMVSGKPPFRGDFDQVVAYSILNESPEPLTAVRTGVPKELERIVNKALSKKPEARYQHVDEMLVDLRELRRLTESDKTRPSPAAAATPPKRKWATWGLAAVLAIVAMAGFWSTRPDDQAGSDTPVLRETPLTSYPGAERHPTFSPDGSQVAFSWNGPNEDNFDIYVQVVGSANPIRVTSDPADDIFPSWSPDGRLIAFRRSTRNTSILYVVPPLGGQERKLYEGPIASRLSWSPDGSTVVFSTRPPQKAARIMRVPVEAGEPEVLVPPVWDVRRETNDGDHSLSFSPDGQRLAWVRFDGGWSLLVKELDQDRISQVIPLDGRTRDPVWSPDGTRLIYVVGAFPRTGFGGANSRLEQTPIAGGSPQPVPGTSTGANDPAVSATSARLAYARVSADANIWRVDLSSEGTVPERRRKLAASSTQGEIVPRISPSGGRIAFVSDRTGGERQVWVCDSDGANPRQITSFDEIAASPRWSPDGKKIAFDSQRSGRFQVFVVNSDGDQLRQITFGDYENMRPAWSGDGEWIYFVARREEGSEIWKMPLEGGDTVQVADAPAIDPFESYDGRWVYFRRPNRLWRVPVAGGPEEIVSEGINLGEWAWSLDRQGNVYWVEWDEESEQWAVRKLDLDGEISDVVLMDRPLQGRAGLDVAPDGTWLLYAQDDQSQSDLMLVENFR